MDRLTHMVGPYVGTNNCAPFAVATLAGCSMSDILGHAGRLTKDGEHRKRGGTSLFGIDRMLDALSLRYERQWVSENMRLCDILPLEGRGLVSVHVKGRVRHLLAYDGKLVCDADGSPNRWQWVYDNKYAEKKAVFIWRKSKPVVPASEVTATPNPKKED